MRITLQNFYIFTLVILVTISPITSSSAGVSGRLKGKVIDKETREPLPGVAIEISNSLMTATTDAKGEFLIIGIDAGTYDVSAEFEPYQKITYIGFSVYPDIMNELDFELSAQGIRDEDIVLEAENVSSKSDDPYTRRLVNSKTFARQPHHSLNDIILQSSGDVYSRNNSTGLTFANSTHRTQKLHFRGRAGGEAGYYLDGMRLNDGATGSVFISLPYRAIDLVTVNTGGYDAKYGQFGTGMVQIVPKRGGDTFTSSAELRTDAAASALGSESYGHNIFSATASGPIIKNSLRFFAAGEFSTTDDADPGVFGHPVFRFSQDGVVLDPLINDTVLFRTKSNGDLIYKKGARPHGANSEQLTNLYGNVSYTPFPSLQVDLTILYAFEKRNTFTTSYLFSPQLVPHRERSTTSTGISAKYFLSGKMFLQGRLSYYSSDNELTQRNLFSEGSRAIGHLTDYVRGNTGYTTYYNDNLIFDIDRGYPLYQKSESQTWSAGLEWNWQWQKDHLLECGIGTQEHSERLLQIIDVDNPISGANNIYGYEVTLVGNYPDSYYDVKHLNSDIPFSFDGPKKPVMSYVYIKDHYSFKSFHFQGGIRVDYFNNGVKDYTFSNYWYKSADLNKDFISMTGSDVSAIPQMQNMRKTYFRWSPRIAVAADFSKNIVARTNYGKFYQMPVFQNILVSNHQLEEQTFSPSFLQNIPNSSLRPQKTEAIEIGLNYSNGNDLSADLSYFRNDVTGVILRGLAINDPNQLATLANEGSVQVSGFNIRFEKKFFDNFSGGIFATHLRSNLTSAEKEEGFSPDWVYEGQSQTTAPSPDEQRWTIKCFADLQLQPNEGPIVAGMHPLENMNFFIMTNIANGFPYTPTPVTRYRIAGIIPDGYIGYSRNSGRTPATISIDAKISKHFELFEHYRATAYIEILNLLNRKNPVAVFPGTGDPQTDGYLATTDGQAMSVREKQQYDYVTHNNFNYSNPRLVYMGLMLEF